MGYFLQQLINGLTLGAIYGLIAIGYTMVYGIIGMINFAHGEIYMIGAFISLIAFLILAPTGGAMVVLALVVVLIVRQMRQQGLETMLVSGDALVTNEYWSITGKAGEGTLMTFSPDPRKEKTAAAVVAKFRADGYEPEGYTLYTYGAIQTWAQAVEKIGGTDTGELSRYLKSNQFDTVLGRLGFDEKGDVTAPGYVFYEWKDGKYDYYVAPGA